MLQSRSQLLHVTDYHRVTSSYIAMTLVAMASVEIGRDQLKVQCFRGPEEKQKMGLCI